MARINIEDSLFSDSRFLKLVLKLGSSAAALGAVVFAFRLAQKYWLTPENLIPKKAWDELEIGEEIINVGLAEIVDGYVYVCGSKYQFKWLEQCSKAGKKSALNKRTGVERALNGSTTGEAPLTLSLSHSLSLNTKTKNNICANQENNADKSAARQRLAEFDQIFLEAYSKYPRKLGKQKGLTFLRRDVKTEIEARQTVKAVERYTEKCKQDCTEEKYIKHFSTWVREWRDWLDYETPKKRDLVDVLREHEEQLARGKSEV